RAPRSILFPYTTLFRSLFDDKIFYLKYCIESCYCIFSIQWHYVFPIRKPSFLIYLHRPFGGTHLPENGLIEDCEKKCPGRNAATEEKKIEAQHRRTDRSEAR